MSDKKKEEQDFFPGITSLSSVYFVGIGGIGMSAIARFFHHRGVKVRGYDKTPTVLTRELEKSGIRIDYDDDDALVAKEAELVVYTPAIPKEHRGLQFYQQNGYKVVKRSDVLQMITESSFNICIAGTHGKTTITTMVAHLLRHSGYGCNAFLGGISVNYGTNFWSHDNNVCVIEADEYDRSFLKLSPDIAVITSMDPDHLDIYGTAEQVEQAFIDFSGRVKPGGILYRQYGLKRGKELRSGNHFTYSLQNDAADVYASNIRMNEGGYDFDVLMKDNMIDNVRLNMGGMHNVENAIAAIAVASSLKIENGKIRDAVEAFTGVKRRFEYIVRNRKVVFIDDYAHHPEELRALITGAKTLFRQRKCTVIFQPHLFTRTRDNADGFANVLDMADQVLLMPIYPAREKPIEGVTSEMILGKMQKRNNSVMDRVELLEWVRNEFVSAANTEFGELIITAGAGDIDTLVPPIKEELEKI